MVRAVTLAVVIALAGEYAHAAYTGLTLIPTAEALGPGHVCMDQQLDGPFPVGSGVDVSLLNTQMGVGNRAEVGVDFDFTKGAEAGALFNGKLVLRPGGGGWSVAVGVHGIGEGLSPTTYAVAGHDWRERLQVHAGAQRTPGGEVQGFAGVVYELGERIQLWLEHVAGEENASAVSLACELTEHWGISFGWQGPNDGEAEASYSLHVGCVIAPS
jgi:hypothetical protein